MGSCRQSLLSWTRLPPIIRLPRIRKTKKKLKYYSLQYYYCRRLLQDQFLLLLHHMRKVKEE